MFVYELRKVKFVPALNYALCYEDVWGSGSIDPHFLDLGTRLYNTILSQIYWGFGLCPLSSSLKTRTHYISETESVSILRFVGEDTYSVGSHNSGCYTLSSEPFRSYNPACFQYHKVSMANLMVKPWPAINKELLRISM
jgi:hypothetical protein